MLNLNFGGSKPADSPFPPITSLPDDIRELLEQYSGIPPKEVIGHIEEVRITASQQYAYPMITQLRFLRLSLSQHPSYSTVLSILKQKPSPSSSSPQQTPPLILDIGPGLGQDIRKLIHDGIPRSSIVGLELDPGLLEIGYTLFRDRSTLDVPFIIGDILALSNSNSNTNANSSSNAKGNGEGRLPDLTHKFSIIHLSSFLHLFPLPIHHRLLHAMLPLLVPSPGSRILGWQLGSPQGMDYFDSSNFSLQYRHSEETFRELWADVGRGRGGGEEWRVVRCELGWREETVWGEPGGWALEWEVERVR